MRSAADLPEVRPGKRSMGRPGAPVVPKFDTGDEVDAFPRAAVLEEGFFRDWATG